MKVLPLHALQAARPLRGLDDPLRKMVVLPQVGDVKIVSRISTFVLNTLVLKVLYLSIYLFIHLYIYFSGGGGRSDAKGYCRIKRLNVSTQDLAPVFQAF